MHKSEQLTARSGRISPKIVPIFFCWPHCRKEGSLSVDVLGIFATMLKGNMRIEESLSMERGGWKCSDMMDYIASALSLMTDSIPGSARYT